MDQAHRKIELQSPSDLIYLQSNANTRARERLDIHFPPTAAPSASTDTQKPTSTTAAPEPDMRDRVDQLMQSYITSTFALLAPNISVNGLDISSSSSEYHKLLTGGAEGADEALEEDLEPYDHRLAKRLQDASAQIESLTLELANLRRTAPAEAKTLYSESTRKREEAWRIQLREAEEREMVRAREVDVSVEGLDHDRAEGVRRSWERARMDLDGVEGGIGGTIARLERAREVVGYLDGRA